MSNSKTEQQEHIEGNSTVGSNSLTSIFISPYTRFSEDEWNTNPITLTYMRAHALYSLAEVNEDSESYDEAVTLISSTIDGEPNQASYKTLKSKLSSRLKTIIS